MHSNNGAGTHRYNSSSIHVQGSRESSHAAGFTRPIQSLNVLQTQDYLNSFVINSSQWNWGNGYVFFTRSMRAPNTLG